jgi:glycosyltransferase involved in cell wall biosynthesis/GT2 family glycosyltransferase
MHPTAARTGARRVLFHSYHFPPIGGSGAQRPARMVRYLPELGYEPVVVTAPGPAGERWTPRDETLDSAVSPDTIVLRVPGPEPASSTGWRRRTRRWLRSRDPWTRSWISQSTRLGIRAAAEMDFDLVYAWMQPYASGEAAAEIARAVGKPWVADLGDPWALDEMMIYPTALHRRLERQLMGQVLRTASAIVLSTPEAEARVRAEFPELASIPISVIPNGFDEASFADAPPTRDDEAFRIVHTGYLHTDLGHRQHRTAALRRLLGGATRGVDIMSRSPVFLVEAVERIRRERPDVAENLELHFAGVLSPNDLAVANRSPASRIHGFLPHADSIALMRSADLLFLPMHDLPEGARATVVPGKTYEYLASGRPILAAVPHGDAHDLLSAAGTASLCRPDDVESMATAIVTAYERERAGVPPPAPPPELLHRYEYRTLADELATVFDGICGARLPALQPTQSENGSRQIRRRAARASTIGVVIRTLNESELIETCLDTLEQQRGGFELDIVVVDSGSTDSTVEISRARGVRIISIDPADFDYSKALNIGIDQVDADLVISLSAHAIPVDERWLETMTAAFEDPAVAGVSCRQVPWPGAPWQEVHRLAYQFGETGSVYSNGGDDEEVVFSNAASVIRQSVWREHPFTLPAAEDLDWARRVVAAGWKVVYESTAAVFHSHDEPPRAQALRMIDIHRLRDEGAPRRTWLRTVREAAGMLVRDSRKIWGLDEPFSRKSAYLADLLQMVSYYVVDFSRSGTTAERRRERSITQA